MVKTAAKKIWCFIKKHWKPLLTSVFAIFFVLFVYKKIQDKRTGQRGRVDSPQNFVPINDHTIVVKSNDGKWIEASLPADMKTKDVTAAQIISAQTVLIEVRHEKTNRRDATLRSDNAIDELEL